MSSGKNTHRPVPFCLRNHSLAVFGLFSLLLAFGFQGCVIHSHNNPDARYKTKTYSSKNHRDHQHRDAHYRKSAPQTVNKIPHHEKSYPSHMHQPPAHARAYEVARGKPFTDDEHPSSQGQRHKVNRDKRNQGKPFTENRHPSSHGQEPKTNQGNAFSGQKSHHARNNGNQKNTVVRDQPHGDKQPPSSHGQNHKISQGKPDKGMDHPSSHEQDQKAIQNERSKGKNHAPVQAKMNQGNHGPGANPDKGGPPHKKQDRAGLQERLDNNRNHPSSEKGKPAFDNPVASVSGSHQKLAGKKPDKVKRKQTGGKEKQKDSVAEHSGQENASESILSAPEENIQIAKADPVHGKNRIQKNTKPHKAKPGKQGKQMDSVPATPSQDLTSGPAQPEVTTASLAPAKFDSHQRTVIQNYYQNSSPSGSSKGKGRGQSAKKSKKNKSGTVSRNDIFTQPTEPLPRDLESQLPPPPPNTVRGVYNQQVLLIENGTHKVLDVIDWSR